MSYQWLSNWSSVLNHLLELPVLLTRQQFDLLSLYT